MCLSKAAVDTYLIRSRPLAAAVAAAGSATPAAQKLYVLSIRRKTFTLHCKLDPVFLHDEQEWRWSKLGSQKSFTSVQELLEYYRTHSVADTGAGCYTRFPFSPAESGAVGGSSSAGGGVADGVKDAVAGSAQAKRNAALQLLKPADEIIYGDLLKEAYRGIAAAEAAGAADAAAHSKVAAAGKGGKKGEKKRKRAGKQQAAVRPRKDAAELQAAASALLALPHDASGFASFVKVREAVMHARQLAAEHLAGASSEAVDSDEDRDSMDWVLKEPSLPPSQFIALSLRACSSVLGDLSTLDDELMASMLKATTNVLQGLELGALRSEDPDVVSELQMVLESLLGVVTRPDLQSAVCECLVSLIMTRGDLAGILATLQTLITTPGLRDCTFNPPKILSEFACIAHEARFPMSRRPVWLDCLQNPTKCCIDSWTFHAAATNNVAVGDNRHPNAEKPLCMALDGSFAYLQFKSQLLKVGTGFGGSTRGQVIAAMPTSSASSGNREVEVWIGIVNGQLYRRFTTDSPGIFTILNCETLSDNGVVVQEEGDSLIGSLPGGYFATGDALGVIEATQQGWRVRYFEAINGMLKCANHHLMSSRTMKMLASSFPEKSELLPSTGQHDYTYNEINALGTETDPIKLIGNKTANFTLTAAGEVFVQGQVSPEAEDVSSSSRGLFSGNNNSAVGPPEPTVPWQQVQFPEGVAVSKVDVYNDTGFALFVTTDGRLFGLGNLPSSSAEGSAHLLSCTAALHNSMAAGLLYAAPKGSDAKVVAATFWKGAVTAAMKDGTVVSLSAATNDAAPTKTKSGRMLSRSTKQGGAFYCGTLTSSGSPTKQQGLFGSKRSSSSKTCTAQSPCSDCKELLKSYPVAGRLVRLDNDVCSHALMPVVPASPGATATTVCELCRTHCVDDFRGYFKSTTASDYVVCSTCVAKHQAPLLNAKPLFSLPEGKFASELQACLMHLVCKTDGGDALWWTDSGSSNLSDAAAGCCKAGEHTFVPADQPFSAKVVCLVCPVCLFCTGYGSNCAVTPPDGKPHLQDRAKTECGCGTGDPGCQTCRCCKTCAARSSSEIGLFQPERAAAAAAAGAPMFPSGAGVGAYDTPSLEALTGMKLEAIDRANPSLTCVATIAMVDVAGHPHAPLKIHFDGWTSKYDYWAELSSAGLDLFPVGHCAAVGSKLQAPKGESSDLFSWGEYLAKSPGSLQVPQAFFDGKYAAAAGGSSRSGGSAAFGTSGFSGDAFGGLGFAGSPLTSFGIDARVPPPPKRKKNGALEYLEVGMKLEAVDRQNPHLGHCVATVAGIDPVLHPDTPILIHFDGWTSKYDYWTAVDSGDLQPAFTAEENGTPLQAPKDYRHADGFDWDEYLEDHGGGMDLVPEEFFEYDHTLEYDHQDHPPSELGMGRPLDSSLFAGIGHQGFVDPGTEIFSGTFASFGGLPTPTSASIDSSIGGGSGGSSADATSKSKLKCKEGVHTWKHGMSKICSKCNQCTTFGSACHNSEGRAAMSDLSRSFEAKAREGMGANDCGCGMGHSGCSLCSICLTCHEKEHPDDSENDGQDMFNTETSSFDGDGTDRLENSATKGAVSAPQAAYLLSQDAIAGTSTVSIACGTTHFLVLQDDGSVYVSGMNAHGQLGTGDTRFRAKPERLAFDFGGSRVISIAAGDSYSIFLCDSGAVYTAGSCNAVSAATEAAAAPATTGAPRTPTGTAVAGVPGANLNCQRHPTLVPNADQDLDGLAAVWASGNRAFFLCGKSITVDTQLQRATCIGTRTELALIFPPSPDSFCAPVVTFNVKSGTCRTVVAYGEDSELADHERLWAVDVVHGVVVSCELQDAGNNVMRAMHPCAGTLDPSFTVGRYANGARDHILTLNPSITLPLDQSHVSAGQLGAHTLTSLCGLTLGPLPVVDTLEIAAVVEKPWDASDYSVCQRFKSSGGSWGYSGSDDAIAFTVDQPILCPGVGLYGKPNFTATVRIYDFSDERSGNPKEGAELSKSDVDVEFGTEPAEEDEWHRIMFETPVLLEADTKYSIRASIKGAGASSKSGSGGNRKVEAEGGVNFSFHHSSQSHNGTDTNSGQIPAILFRLPPGGNRGKKASVLPSSVPPSASTTFPSQHVSAAAPSPSSSAVPRSLCSPLSEDGATTILQMLRWCVDSYSADEGASVAGGSGFLAHIGTTCLTFLKAYINRFFDKDPCSGQLTCRMSKHAVQRESAYMLILDTRDVVAQLLNFETAATDVFSTLVADASAMYGACFAVFHPTTACRARFLRNLLRALGNASEGSRSVGNLELFKATVRYLATAKVGLHNMFDADNRADVDELVLAAASTTGKEVEDHAAISEITVSTNTGEGQTLWDTSSSYWESSGNSGTHWIMIELQPGVVVRSLQVHYSVSAHDSYRPASMRVDVGDSSSLTEDDRVDDIPCESGKSTTEVLADCDSHFRFVKVGISASGINCRINTVTCEGVLMAPSSTPTTGVLANPFTAFVEEQDGASHLDEDNSINGNLADCIIDLIAISTSKDIEVDKRATLFADVRLLVHSCVESLAMLRRDAAYVKAGTSTLQNIDDKLIAVFEIILQKFEAVLLEVHNKPHDHAIEIEALKDHPMVIIIEGLFLHIGSAVKVSGHVAQELSGRMRTLFRIVADMRGASTVSTFDQQCKAMADAHSDSRFVVESAHPYQAASVDIKVVTCADDVEWMVVRFDSKSQTVQAEDKVELIGRGGVGAPVYATFSGKHWPEHDVVVPGNRLCVRLSSATVGAEADAAPGSDFGYLATVSGHRQRQAANLLDALEREIAVVASSSILGLMQRRGGSEHLAASPSPLSSVPEYAGAVMALSPAAQPWLESPMLSCGLLKDQELEGCQDEQNFLKDFVDLRSGTVGGATAIWLQLERPLDAAKCTMHPLSPQEGEQELKLGQSYSCLVCTHSFDGTLVHYPDGDVSMNVTYEAHATDELSVAGPASFAPQQEADSNEVGRMHTLSSIVADPACKKSAEELRIEHIATSKGFTHNYLVRDGIYKMAWTPEATGKMQLAIMIDGQHIQGSPFQYDVVDPLVTRGSGSAGNSVSATPSSFGGDVSSLANSESSDSPCPDAVMGNTPRRVKCMADSHPVRAGPSLEAFEIGEINAGTTFIMSGESMTTADGIWVLVDKSAPLKSIDQGMQHLDAWILQSSMAGAGGGDHVDEDELEDREDEEEDDDSVDNDLEAEERPMPGLLRDDDAAAAAPVHPDAALKVKVFLQEMDGTLLPAFNPDGDADAFDSEGEAEGDDAAEGVGGGGGGAADADGAAAAVAAALAEPADWSCVACTFLNASHRPSCEICGTSAPAPEAVAIVAPPPSQDAPVEPEVVLDFATSEQEGTSIFAKSTEEDLCAQLPEAVTVECNETAAKRARALFAAFLWHSGQAPAALRLVAGSALPERSRDVSAVSSNSVSIGSLTDSAVALFENSAPAEILAEDNAPEIGSKVWAWPPGVLLPRSGRVVKVASEDARSFVGPRIVGMKLEAKDRKNPRMICPATIVEMVNAEQGLVKVHFDGWKENYDYEAKLDNEDLHPVGFCALTKHKLEAPKGHKGNFSWGPYLQATASVAVPVSILSHQSNKDLLERTTATSWQAGTVATPLHAHVLKIVLPHESVDGACEKCSADLTGILSHQSTEIPKYKLCITCVGATPLVASPDASYAVVLWDSPGKDDDGLPQRCHLADIRSMNEADAAAAASAGAGSLGAGAILNEQEPLTFESIVQQWGVTTSTEPVVPSHRDRSFAQLYVVRAWYGSQGEKPGANGVDVTAQVMAMLPEGQLNGQYFKLFGRKSKSAPQSPGLLPPASLTIQFVFGNRISTIVANEGDPVVLDAVSGTVALGKRLPTTVVDSTDADGDGESGAAQRDTYRCIEGLRGVSLRNSPVYSDRGGRGPDDQALVEAIGKPEVHNHLEWIPLANGSWLPLTTEGKSKALFELVPELSNIADADTDVGGATPTLQGINGRKTKPSKVEVCYVTQKAMLLLDFAPKSVRPTSGAAETLDSGSLSGPAHAVFTMMQSSAGNSDDEATWVRGRSERPGGGGGSGGGGSATTQAASVPVPPSPLVDTNVVREQIALLLQSRASPDEIRGSFTSTSSLTSCHVLALTMLNEFLQSATSLEVVYDLLWSTISCLSETVVGGDVEPDADDGLQGCPWALQLHPLTGLEAPADALRAVEVAFNRVLGTTLRLAKHLPAESPLQLVAFRCCAINLRPKDLDFVTQSQFIEILGGVATGAMIKANHKEMTAEPSATEQTESERVGVEKGDPKDRKEDGPSDGHVVSLVDVNPEQLAKMVSVSSKTQNVDRLTDGKTENAWQSDGTSERNCVISLNLGAHYAADGDGGDGTNSNHVCEFALYIDNVKDAKQQVREVKVSIGDEGSELTHVLAVPVSQTRAGWLRICLPSQRVFSRFVEFTFVAMPKMEAIRVRQIRAFATDGDDGGGGGGGGDGGGGGGGGAASSSGDGADHFARAKAAIAIWGVRRKPLSAFESLSVTDAEGDVSYFKIGPRGMQWWANGKLEEASVAALTCNIDADGTHAIQVPGNYRLIAKVVHPKGEKLAKVVDAIEALADRAGIQFMVTGQRLRAADFAAKTEPKVEPKGASKPGRGVASHILTHAARAKTQAKEIMDFFHWLVLGVLRGTSTFCPVAPHTALLRQQVVNLVMRLGPYGEKLQATTVSYVIGGLAQAVVQSALVDNQNGNRKDGERDGEDRGGGGGGGAAAAEVVNGEPLGLLGAITITAEGHLKASCKDSCGQLQDSLLDLNEHVGNKDGKFDLAGTNFAKSARALKLAGATLSCELQTASGKWIPASVDLDTVVENQNGRLGFINTDDSHSGNTDGGDRFPTSKMGALLSLMPAIIDNCDVVDLMRPEKQLVKTLVRIVHFGSASCKRQALDLLVPLLARADPAAVNSAMGASDGMLGTGPYAYLVLALAKACTLQMQVPGRPVVPVTMAAAFASMPPDVPSWFHGPAVPVDVAAKIASILVQLNTQDSAHMWAVVQAEARERIAALATVETDLAAAQERALGGDGSVADHVDSLLVASPLFWLAIGSLFIVDERTIAAIADAAEVQRSGTILMCSNHGDGVTEATMSCEACGLHFCDECDHVVHLPRSKRSHPRNQVARKGAEIIVARDKETRSTSASTLHLLLSCEHGNTFGGLINVQTGEPLQEPSPATDC